MGLRAWKKSQSPVTTKASNRNQIDQYFKHGNFYNQAECFINDESIAFVRGQKHAQLKFNEHGFVDQFDSILRKFEIENPFKKPLEKNHEDKY